MDSFITDLYVNNENDWAQKDLASIEIFHGQLTLINYKGIQLITDQLLKLSEYCHLQRICLPSSVRILMSLTKLILEIIYFCRPTFVISL
jgi:hypothetical protein